VKILHTADLHLRTDTDDRWHTLEAILRLGKEAKADLLVISGDLFDNGGHVETLRPSLRALFDATRFPCIIIPGNHDAGVYTEGMYFGQQVIVITDMFVPFETGGARIVGLPFEQVGQSQLLSKLHVLKPMFTRRQRNILLFHGELLDTFFSREDFGDEGKGRYMPARLDYFRNLGVDYVLAGHFHARFDVWKLHEHAYFVYPGSPVSVTRREMGPRKVNLFDLGQPPSEYILPTPYFEHISLRLDPFSLQDPLQCLRELLQDLSPHAKPILTVTGFVNGQRCGLTESQLIAQMRGIASPRCVDQQYEFTDIRHILEDDLFHRFTDKLADAVYSQQRRSELRSMVLRAMARARS
jgi:predicted phosphodiesterase